MRFVPKNIRRSVLLGCLVWLRAPAPADAAEEQSEAIAFSGVMTDGAELRLALTLTETGVTRWLRLGETVAGRTLRAYDEAGEWVTLSGDGGELRLRLKQAKVRAGGDGEESGRPPGAVTTAARAVIRENLRMLAAAARYFFAASDRPRAEAGDLIGPGRMIAVLRAAAGEDYGAVRIGRGETRCSVMTAGGETVTIDAQDDPTAEASYHLWRAGDTLGQVAAAAGTTLQRILEWNELAEPENAPTGRLLRVK